MRVLLTGASGFIGGAVAEALDAAGHDVRPFDLRTGQDVRDAGDVARALRGVDAVCHQAAKVGLGVDVSDLPDYTSHNVQGTAVLLAEMARAGVAALVLASSMVVYGEGAYRCAEHGAVAPGPRAGEALRAGRFEPPCPRCGAALLPGTVTEDARLDPRNAYADSKTAQEHLAASWARMTEGSVAALRYHNVYGPRMPRDTPYAGVAALFRSRLERGEPPLVFEDGAQRRDFVHVRDVARANLLALENPPDAGTLRAYNVASGTPRTIGEMAGAMADAYGGPEPVVTGRFRLGDVRHIVAAPGRARDELGFAARVPFGEGVAAFAVGG
ncbi:NAD-dependent epimerase/dehydratase family protein [Actinomadura flavalba]|uniref:NAD-dependent epimerase/dehydratase family protein n=1 Tax=Actinomadura flavalba TaxID=1120938 RepID=UPI0004778833|nr:NAD-dependent epimerase/dehydratase family protein [Actinomadura flavalba]